MDNKYLFNRESNIELFRIVVMMSIIAHHMVVSGYYLIYSFGIVVAIYVIGALVDVGRMFLFEKPIFKLLQKYFK